MQVAVQDQQQPHFIRWRRCSTIDTSVDRRWPGDREREREMIGRLLINSKQEDSNDWEVEAEEEDVR